MAKKTVFEKRRGSRGTRVVEGDAVEESAGQVAGAPAAQGDCEN